MQQTNHNPLPRINLDTCYPLRTGATAGLPVLVDLNWYGPTMTGPTAGIIYSRQSATRTDADDEVIL